MNKEKTRKLVLLYTMVLGTWTGYIAKTSDSILNLLTVVYIKKGIMKVILIKESDTNFKSHKLAFIYI